MSTNLESIIQNIKLAADYSQDGFCITDTDGIIRYINDPLSAQLGYTILELISKPKNVTITMFDAYDDKDLFDQNYEDYKLIKLASPRSELAFAYYSEKKITDAEGNILGELSIFRFKEPPSINKNILNVLHEISQLPLKINKEEEIFSAIHLLISSVIYAQNFYIFLTDEYGELRPVYFTDKLNRDGTELTEIFDLAKISYENSKPILYNSSKILELISENKIRVGVETPVHAMCVPLKIKNNRLGVIAAQIFNPSYTYSKTDLQLLSYAANQIAITTEETRITNTLNKTLDDIINLVEAVPFGVVLVSEEKKIELINDKALTLLNMPFEMSLEELNKELFSSTPDGITVLETNESDSLEEIKLVSGKENEGYLLKSSKKITFNSKNVYLITFIDVSELKSAQELINRLSQTVFQSTNSIIITDNEGIIEFVNPKFCEETGYSNEEIIGMSIGITQSPLNDDEIFKEQWEVITNGNQWEGNIYAQTKSEEIYYLKSRVTPLNNSEGVTTHFLYVNEDITERIKAEEELNEHLEELQVNRDLMEERGRELVLLNAKLAESEEMLKEEIASKDKFFSIISHDLKSPLSGLLGLSQMLVEDYEDFSDEERKEFVSMLNTSANKMFELLESLLHWARAQSGRLECKFESIQINKIVDDLIIIYTEVASKKKISLVNKIGSAISIYADENVVNTVIRNLIANAIKFTNEGGEIAIEGSIDNDKAIVTVSDDGIGMSEEDTQKLFKIDVHHTTKGTNKEEGTGLGLILCKELIEKVNGTIWVESQLGEGSKFKFTVPLQK